jgi:PAS domain S-box-containing protein
MGKKLRILILEDSLIDAKIIIRRLEKSGYILEWERAYTADDMIQALDSKKWDLVIADYAMGKFDGMQALEILKNKKLDIPFIIVSGFIGEDVAVEAMKLGANDYIKKDNLMLLGPVIERELGEARKREKFKLVQIAHKEIEAKLSAIANTTSDAIIMINNEAKVTFWNHAAEKMFGYKNKDVLHNNVNEYIIPKTYWSNFWDGFNKFKTCGKGLVVGKTVELIVINKNEEYFPIEVTVSSMRIRGEWHAAGIIRNITDRKKAESELKSLVKEKEVLVKEIHHRVKNNFNIIISLCHLQAKHVEDKIVSAALNECKNRIQSMMIIHEKLYKSKDLQNIDISDYLKAMVNNLYKSFGADPNSISIRYQLERINLTIEKAIPCGLIVNELITNSLKYGFPELLHKKGEMKISIRKDNQNKIELRVSDNGTGIPANFNIKKSESLGLKLVVMLAEGQLQGKIRNKNDDGAEFIINFEI